MGRGLTLILGGARSGKSSHAQQLAAERGSSVVFVATAEPSDEEISNRLRLNFSRPYHAAPSAGVTAGPDEQSDL